MYYNNKINQASRKEKSLLTTSFSYKDSQTDHLTATQFKIAQYIHQYKNRPWIKLSNKRIADAVGCSIITVIRATNKFHKDGYITKYQENQYTSNNYTLSMVVDHKNKRIFQSEYDTPNKKDLLLDKYLFRRPIPIPISRGRTEDRYKKRGIGLDKNSIKKGNGMNDMQKELIREYRYDPKMKNYLTMPNVREMIITPAICALSDLLSLDDQEHFRLTPFSDEALEHAFNELEPIVNGKKVLKFTIADKMAWVMSLLLTYCKKNNLRPDWKWYYDLCDITGMDAKGSFKKKPLIIQKFQQVINKLPKITEKGRKSNWQHMQQLLPLEARVSRWKSEIQRCENLLANFPLKGYGGPGYIERMIVNAKEELEQAQKLLERERSDEKQVILYQGSADSMAQGCA